MLKKLTDDLLDHVGDATAAQKILIRGAAFKALRVTLFADRMLNDPAALGESSDHNLLAWSNSLRHDLQALGLEKRERPTLDLARYLTQGREVAAGDAAEPVAAPDEAA